MRAWHFNKARELPCRRAAAALQYWKKTRFPPKTSPQSSVNYEETLGRGSFKQWVELNFTNLWVSPLPIPILYLVYCQKRVVLELTNFLNNWLTRYLSKYTMFKTRSFQRLNDWGRREDWSKLYSILTTRYAPHVAVHCWTVFTLSLCPYRFGVLPVAPGYTTFSTFCASWLQDRSLRWAYRSWNSLWKDLSPPQLLTVGRKFRDDQRSSLSSTIISAYYSLWNEFIQSSLFCQVSYGKQSTSRFFCIRYTRKKGWTPTLKPFFDTGILSLYSPSFPNSFFHASEEVHDSVCNKQLCSRKCVQNAEMLLVQISLAVDTARRITSTMPCEDSLA